MELNLKLCRNNGNPLPKSAYYRELVGALIYLSFLLLVRVFLMRYIYWVSLLVYINTLCGFHSYPSLNSWHHDSFPTFPVNSPLTLWAYSDASWANNSDIHCSTTGFCNFLRLSLISWHSCCEFEDAPTIRLTGAAQQKQITWST